MSANDPPERDEDPKSPAGPSRRLTDDSVIADSIAEIDGFRVLGLSSDDVDFYTGFDAKRRKRVMHKVSVPAPHNVLWACD